MSRAATSSTAQPPQRTAAEIAAAATAPAPAKEREVISKPPDGWNPDDLQLDVVQVEALVLMKIVKHCRESLPETLVTGHLLGLDVGATLEVTNAFPFPSRSSDNDEEDAEASTEYQMDMMRCLRDVNVDHNTVGWYQSTYLGSFLDQSLVETQFAYQSNLNKCVVLVFDPLRTQQGGLSLKAFRLTKEFIELYKSGNFTQDNLTKTGVTYRSILEEIPVRVHNSHLSTALLYELEDRYGLKPDFERFNLAAAPFMEKNLEFLIDYVDNLNQELNKFQFYQRNLLRLQQQQAQYLARKRADTASRKLAGEVVEDEDLSQNPLFKLPTAPNRLEPLLLANQINQFCDQINQIAGASFGKLYLASELHR